MIINNNSSKDLSSFPFYSYYSTIIVNLVYIFLPRKNENSEEMLHKCIS